ncbi:MAG: hypothetical protein OHK0022_34130 [Roseiflexaceae bacterium]
MRQGADMQSALSHPEGSGEKQGTLSFVINVLFQLARFRNPSLDPNDILHLSGIAPATYSRLMNNRTNRVAPNVLARVCATFRVPISSVLSYLTEGQTTICTAFPSLVVEPITDCGYVVPVLCDVLQGYNDILGKPFHGLHHRIGTQRKTIEALLEPQPSLVDLNILARLIGVLTSVAQKPHPPSQLFASWLQERGYTPGTAEIVLRYIAPQKSN